MVVKVFEKGLLEFTPNVSDIQLFQKIQKIFDSKSPSGVMQTPDIFSTKAQLCDKFHKSNLILVDRIRKLTLYWKQIFQKLMGFINTTVSAIITFELSEELTTDEVLQFLDEKNDGVWIHYKKIAFQE